MGIRGRKPPFVEYLWHSSDYTYVTLMNQAHTHSFIHSSFSGKMFIKCLWYARHNDTIIFFPCYSRGIGVWIRSPTIVTSKAHWRDPNPGLLAPKAQESFSLSPVGFGLGCFTSHPRQRCLPPISCSAPPSKPLCLNAFEWARAFPHSKIAVRLGFFYAYKNKFKSKNAHFKILN